MIRSVRVAVVSILSCALAGSGAVLAGAQAAPADSLTLTADGVLGGIVSGVGQLSAAGDTAVDVEVVDVDGGRVRTVAGPGLSLPLALQFPTYGDSSTYPRAVVSVTPTSGQALSPGSSDFEYGAVFRLDATSSGDTVDNGDNLFQRGLFNEDSLYKLQLDNGRPACMVRGSAGRVKARLDSTITPDRWYRATCSRVGNRVSLAVTPYAGGETDRSDSSGEIGSLRFPASRPASIGGKLDASGGMIQRASDQFNGAVAQVWIERR